MTRFRPSRSQCLAEIDSANRDITFTSMIAIQMLLTRSPLGHWDAERVLGCGLARLFWRDHADVALCSAAVPRPSGSSLMPLRRAPRRPDLARGVGVRAFQSNYGIQSDQFNVMSVGLQPQQTNPIRRRGGIGAWRSEIKEELAALGRCGGHSRSYAPVPPRLAKPSSEIFRLPVLTGIRETGSSSARAFA